jgi:hypothetical protein
MPDLPIAPLHDEQAHGPLQSRTTRGDGSPSPSPAGRWARVLRLPRSGWPVPRRLLDWLVGLDWLDIATRLGLALFLTVGCASSLVLYAGRSLDEPSTQMLCAGIFGAWMVVVGLAECS